MLSQIVELCIIPLLGILTKYLIDYLTTKQEEAKAKVANELASKYMTMIYATITNCVIATNQVYVDSLKNKGTFDREAQQKAFNETLTAVK